MRVLAAAGVVVLCLAALFAADGRAGPLAPGNVGKAVQHYTLAIPVLVWRDCQRIALCTGCAPVFKCRSCSYQRTCAGGVCSWGDVCVWGPYVKVLPRGARVIPGGS
ncbi:MAG: hypothetical protein ACREDO_11235 [Methyloceanibacter sp.]